MKKKKRAKSGPKVKIKDAHRATWNITGEDIDWIREQSDERGISESEFIRMVLLIARNNFYSYSKAV